MPIAPVTLDFARTDEVAAIAAMSRDLVECGLGWRYRPAQIRALMADSDAVVLAARHAGTLAGFAAMRIGEARAHLVLLAVAPAHRRAGVGRELVSWLLKSAAVAGVASVHVELRTGNRAAYELYRLLGFEATQRVARYYDGREPALRMILRLRPLRRAAPGRVRG